MRANISFSFSFSSIIIAAGLFTSNAFAAKISPTSFPWMNAKQADTTYSMADHPNGVFVFETFSLSCSWCNKNASNVDALATKFKDNNRVQVIDLGIDSSDSNFTWEQFAGIINKDLADVLGNFVNRVTKFCVARFDGKLPGEGVYGDEEKALIAELDRRIKTDTDYLEAADFRKAMGELRAIWVAGNEYMTRAAPWTHIKTDRDKAAVGVRMGLNLIHVFSHLCWPVMPAMARVMHLAIQPIADNAEVLPWPDYAMAKALDELEAGQPITAPDVLFAKISDEQIAEWKVRVG